jgi:hypothetical protein
MYKNGKVANHEGSWHAARTARIRTCDAGGAKGRAEVLSGGRAEAGDGPAEVQSVSDKVKVPAGEFKDCVKTEETTPLEPGERETKIYAPHVGCSVTGR